MFGRGAHRGRGGSAAGPRKKGDAAGRAGASASVSYPGGPGFREGVPGCGLRVSAGECVRVHACAVCACVLPGVVERAHTV